jgi:hypothetical protein
VCCAAALLVIGVIFAACDSPLHFPKNMSPARPLRDTGIRMVVIGDGLPKVRFSYRQAELDMAPAVLTVTNTSNETTGPLIVSLSWPEIQIRQTEVLFEVAGGAIGALVPGGSAEFEVKATGLGLRVGEYPVTVTVSDADGLYFS